MPLLKEQINDRDRHLIGKTLAYVLGFDTPYPDMDHASLDPVSLSKRILTHLQGTLDTRFKPFKPEMVDKAHPWIQGCLEKVKTSLKDTTKLSDAAIYVRMLNNPYTTPAEVLSDFRSAFSSPEPKKRKHDETFGDQAHALASVKVETTPKIKEGLSDEEYLVQVGQKIKDYKCKIEYHANKIKTLEKKQADVKSQLAMRMLGKQKPN